MTDPITPKTSSEVLAYEDNGNAPFVYFDLVPAHGIMAGAVQIELASRILIPKADGSVEIKLIAAGHLRCSPTAAIHLRNVIDAALKMLEQPQPSPAVAAAKLN